MTVSRTRREQGEPTAAERLSTPDDAPELQFRTWTDATGTPVIFAPDLDGKPQWQIEHGPAYTGDHPGSRSTPTIDGGNLYLVSGNGLVGCRDVKTGKPKWTRQMEEFGGKRPGWGYAESVLIHDNLAAITPGGRLYLRYDSNPYCFDVRAEGS